MALGIWKTDTSVTYSIPLKPEDKQWTIDHLRMLANKLESDPGSSIYSVALETDRQYCVPILKMEINGSKD
jgi:hypothetical protein